MEHRDNTATVDGPSQSAGDHRTPSHRAEGGERKMLLEDIAYNTWCVSQNIDAADPESAQAYERTVGLLYP